MSASLVGSEMCIRDRIGSDGAATKDVSTRRTMQSRSKELPRASAACFSAVSYTHLTLPTICSV
eukprot:7821265-Alexandrium_andersonii.AAC.1